MTFDLLTWMKIGIIYSSRTIYVPILKLLMQSVLELSIAQGMGNQHDLWPWPDLNINRDHLLILDYLPTKFEACRTKHCYRLPKVQEIMTSDLDLWSTDLNINRDHLLIKDYLPTKFAASGAKCSWVISCTRLRETDILTDRPTDRQTCVGAGQNVPMPKRTQPKRTQFWSKRTHFFGQNVPSPPKRTQPFGQNVPNIFFSYL